MKMLRLATLVLGFIVLIAAAGMYMVGAMDTSDRDPITVAQAPSATFETAADNQATAPSFLSKVIGFLTGSGSEKTASVAEDEPTEIRVIRGGNALNGNRGSGRLIKARIAED